MENESFQFVWATEIRQLMIIGMFVRKIDFFYNRIGIVQLNDPVVSVFRFRPSENKLLLHYTITMSKDKT